MNKILPYPEKPTIGCMPTLLDFARDGWLVPEVVVVNENLLADDLTRLIEDNLDHLDMKEKYDLIYDVDKSPFRFTVDLSFDVIEVKSYFMVEITSIGIESSWDKTDLHVKWSEELLTSIIENQVRIMI